MAPSSELLQLAFIDGLFLCLVVGVFLWFRAWMRQQQQSIDDRLKALNEQQQILSRLGERLQIVCRSLEHGGAASVREQGASSGSTPPKRSASALAGDSDIAPRVASAAALSGRAQSRTDSGGPRSGRRLSAPPSPTSWRPRDPDADSPEDNYVEARDLLGRGMAPTEVARRLGMGIAEVNALQRLEQSR